MTSLTVFTLLYKKIYHIFLDSRSKRLKIGFRLKCHPWKNIGLLFSKWPTKNDPTKKLYQ